MGMTIELAMNNLSGILTESTDGEDSVCYVTEDDAETLQVAIKTMRKYQKIEEKVERFKNQYDHTTSLDLMIEIREVIEDGTNK